MPKPGPTPNRQSTTQNPLATTDVVDTGDADAEAQALQEHAMQRAMVRVALAEPSQLPAGDPATLCSTRSSFLRPFVVPPPVLAATPDIGTCIIGTCIIGTYIIGTLLLCRLAH